MPPLLPLPCDADGYTVSFSVDEVRECTDVIFADQVNSAFSYFYVRVLCTDAKG